MPLELFDKTDPTLISERALIGTPEERHAISWAVMTGKTPGFRIKRPDYAKLYGFKRGRVDGEDAAEPVPKRQHTSAVVSGTRGELQVRSALATGRPRARPSKQVRFDESLNGSMAVERCDEYHRNFGKEKHVRLKTCGPCKLINDLNSDIYKFTEMQTHPQSVHNTTFQSKYFHRAETKGDREALLQRIDSHYSEATCEKHGGVIEYVHRNVFSSIV